MKVVDEQIIVVGLGLVGQITMVYFASKAYSVVGIDSNPSIVSNLKNGIPTLYEPELVDHLKAYQLEKRIEYSTEISQFLGKSQMIFCAMGSPLDNDQCLDVSAFTSIVKQIASEAESGKIIVCKSTLPLGTSRKLQNMADEILKCRQREDIQIQLIMNPEFLRSGQALQDSFKQERIVLGGESKSTGMGRILDLYSSDKDRIILTNWESAELAKVASNAFIATKISFINELAKVCEESGADISTVSQIMQEDTRIGKGGLDAGLGFGGSCLPKDLTYLIELGRQTGANMHLAEAVLKVNNEQPDELYNKMKGYFKGQMSGKKIAILGFSFKANTSDIRQSRAIDVIRLLGRDTLNIGVYDPAWLNVSEDFDNLPPLKFYSTIEDCVSGVDAVCICTDWPEFSNFNFLKYCEAQTAIFDGRNVIRNKALVSGRPYFSFGLESSHK